ncbi:MAG: DUF2177 family protein [Gammaproteobacteria bacterium]|nr:DUF2177 family protein [Gammaproteobacteria bacterium]
MQIFKSIVISTVVMLLMDVLWISLVMKQLYLSHMGEFLRIENNPIQFNFFAAAIVYIALITGILIFVIPKAAGNPLAALGWGALFGFICYATYDFTNLAIMKNWPLWLSVVDVAWGCVLCGITSMITVWLG